MGVLGVPRRSATMLNNHSSIACTFIDIVAKYDTLYRKRAFMHWFRESSAVEGDMNEAREHLDY